MKEKAYYDVPMLKPPVWKWEIAAYFFLGGLSAGSFLISRIAARRRLETVSRAGAWIAAVAALPCAPLLIADLGDKSRFHHMLRIFQPRSPMNLGTWLLTGYSPLCMLAALFPRTARWTDPLSVPLAMGMTGYTGVLLSATANPLWCQNAWLGPLFSASAVHSGASAIRLALETTGKDVPEQLTHFEHACSVVKTVSLHGMMQTAGPVAKPLREDPLVRWGALAAGVAFPYLVDKLKMPRASRILSGVAALGGAWALRQALLKNGKKSAEDPKANRQLSSRGAQESALPVSSSPSPAGIPDARAGTQTPVNVGVP